MRKSIKFIPVLLVALFAMGACEKAYLSQKEVVITEPVSFSGDIQPILSASCATPNCHVGGGPPPNLTAASAYNEITQLGYVDTTNAPESILYKLVVSTGSNRMPPPPASPLKAEEIGYILAWIEQGALNN